MIIINERYLWIMCPTHNYKKYIPATKVASSASFCYHDLTRVWEMSTSEAIYYHDHVLSVVPQGIDWISIIMKYWLPVTRQPLSTLHCRSVSIHPPELGRGVNTLNYNKEEKRRRAKYNRGQRVARCALPISQPLMECDRF